MSLKMIHLLTYECEDGLLTLFCETHNERDEFLEDAQNQWEKLGHDRSTTPCRKIDAFVPEDATADEVRAQMEQWLQLQALKASLQNVLMVSQLARLMKDIFSGIEGFDVDAIIGDVLSGRKPEDGEPTVH